MLRKEENIEVGSITGVHSGKMKRAPLKKNSSLKPSKGLKRGYIQKQSQKYKERKEERIEHGKAMIDLFNEHWNSHPDKKCENCGKQLYGENNSCYHDHLLEKGNSRYKHLSLEMDNLFLCCEDCHAKKSNGFPGIKHEQAIEEAKKRFNV